MQGSPPMGFIDYAWNISLQRDSLKLKMIMDSSIHQPTLEPDAFGFTIKLPTTRQHDQEKISYLCYNFLYNRDGKVRIGRLFRAAVLHLTTHTMLPLPKEKIAPKFASNSIIQVFAKTLAIDSCVNAYLQVAHSDKLADIAYANALFFMKLKPCERIITPSTRIMAALLSKVNTGLIKGKLDTELEKTVNELNDKLMTLKSAVVSSLSGNSSNIEGLFDETVNTIIAELEPFGPFLETPSLPHTENIGPCSILNQIDVQQDQEFCWVFHKVAQILGASISEKSDFDSIWRKEQEIEALQAFDAEQHQKAKKEKILARIKQYTAWTRFKQVCFPEEDYTQYLRARTLIQGSSKRLLDSLRVAQNTLDDDYGKDIGQLDLPSVIQAIASKKPATDVFFKEEYLKQSFAWSIVFDTSASMQVKGEYARALLICVAEAAKELLMDPGSWSLYGFNDKFYILKDSSEAYNRQVRARIGGLKFEGLSFLPDAVRVAGQVLTKRFEEQRVLVVISDGYPYGYANIHPALASTVNRLQKQGVIVIGIGVETEKMSTLFKLNAAINTQKDLIKRFAKIYTEASAALLET
ncbi:MAG: hypothetical protein N3E52_03615 [Candidatus Bathyarchaeota archaeon]|nr:hypothetical protein [Candidatus Bathyarchaeota archaeon]